MKKTTKKDKFETRMMILILTYWLMTAVGVNAYILQRDKSMGIMSMIGSSFLAPVLVPLVATFYTASWLNDNVRISVGKNE